MTQALTSALLHFVWQGAAVAFLLWVTLGLLRNRSANARYVVSCAALALMAVLPLITVYVSYQPPVSATATETLAAIPLAAVAASLNLEQWMLRAWFVGVLLFSIRLLWGCRQVSAIRRRGEPADASLLATVADLAQRMHLDRPVRVLISSVAEGPSAMGLFRPVILVPAATVLGLTAQQLEAVLAHELAHIRRHDYLVNIIQMLIETVLFYHPAVWWTSARIRHERELCCDDAAVDCCGDALCYARALTTLERLRITTPRLALGSTGGSMLYRIERLVGVAKYQNTPSRWPGVLALCLGLAVFAANTNWAQGQARPKPQDQPGIKTDVGKSVVIDRTPVEYPEAAIENKVQGTVVVEATVDKTGAVNDARVVSGPQELRKAALQSVLEWHFTPESGGSKRRVSISFETPRPARAVGMLLKDDEAQHDDFEIERLEKQLEDSRVAEDLEKQLDDARQKYTESFPEIQRLKRQLERAQQDLVSHGIAATDEQYRRAQQAQQSTEFLMQRMEELQQRADQEKQRMEGRLEPSDKFGDYRLRIGGDLQAEAAKQRRADAVINCRADGQELTCKPSEFEILNALKGLRANARSLTDGEIQANVAAEEMKSQVDAMRAQMDELKARLEALRAQLEEQQKVPQK